MKQRFDLFRLLLVLTLAVLALWLARAFAGEANLTWVAPTQNCNGTALTNLTGYSLTYGKAKEALPTTPLAKTVTGLTPGTWWFSLAAVTPTDRSEFVTVEKVIPPEQFVTKTTTVYTFVKANGGILVLGTLHRVPLGTQCDANQTVNGKYIIPREAVTWSGSSRPVAVLGDCG